MKRKNSRTAAPLIGVLALQGDYAAHLAVLERLGARTRLVRTARDLAGDLDPAGDLEPLDGLIMPGGESTTMLQLLERDGLEAAIAAFVAERPTFGTCAGVILLARDVTGPEQRSLGVLDVGVARNAYGRQLESFIGAVEAPALGGKIEGVFIRAPRLVRVGPPVTILGRLGEEPVLVEQGHLLGATFHPELTGDARIHRYFLERLAGMNAFGQALAS
jgi:5'-phosphate synthase pdxT subunit